MTLCRPAFLKVPREPAPLTIARAHSVAHISAVHGSELSGYVVARLGILALLCSY